MHEKNFDGIVSQIVARDPRFRRDAYHFVREALDHTQKQVHGEARTGGRKKDQHVNGRQLLDGIRTCALDQFGPMAVTVFEEWGVECCEHFGEIVFNLVDYGNGIFGKTDTDSRNDFKDGYDFQEAFRKPYLPAHRTEARAAETK